ncbi:TonB-dependent receptor [Capnocytophaga leadbetteri]|uniref:TonB-dependent receptor n=1 Tax=Capnocytophaga leadbetteri TaxID=327575 RepID=UPI0028E801F0|nr:TonB-dependent receptor [Capnocytophaga leadbetteri]
MKNVLMYTALCLSSVAVAQQPIESVMDSIREPILLDEVLVSAVRANQKLPITFSNLSKKEIRTKNFGQQLPLLLNHLPNVVSYSDDGVGFGSSYIYVRGSDIYRTNVTINGVPLNDPESGGVFFYNLSDLASSAENIQLQRGVGTSSNGAGAFGASLNVLTEAIQPTASAEIANFYGSYNTHKHSLKFSTGKINDRFELSGRFSVIKSDGYRDRGWSNLKSYFLQGAYAYGGTLIKAILLGGKQHAYLTYLGLDKATLANDRRYNPAGEYTDAAGNKRFYDNESDNYQQDLAQLHWSQQWNEFWRTQIAFHYTKGKGYWENYEKGAYSWIGLPSLGNDPKGEEKQAYYIHQQGLNNDFWGTTFSANYKKDNIDLLVGGALNRYQGAHIKDLLWAEKAYTSYKNNYSYEGLNTKEEASGFAKLTYTLNSKWSLFADMQLRYVNYEAKKHKVDEASYNFNPKMGVTFNLNPNNSFYLSYARATKEPNRSDYKDYAKELKKNALAKKPVAEKLNDFELGWRYQSDKVVLNINGYYMGYQDQLIPTGKLNETGYPIRENVGSSYRSGIEADATVNLSTKWIWQPNVAFSKNITKDYKTEKKKVITYWGDTQISYSPSAVIGNTISFLPIKNFQASLISKYVGSQYIDNTQREEAKLDAYFVNNLSLQYEWNPKHTFKSVLFSVIGNNILNAKYTPYGSNKYGESYIPAAEAHYLAGITLSF